MTANFNLPLTIKETQNGLLEKEYSAVQLVDSYLERIKKSDKDINSFITITEEVAYEKAKLIDDLLENEGKKALETKPLLGVVIAHKDLYLTKGIRTTAGSKVLDSFIPQYSGTVVKRLEDSGCILIGKTNCDAWAHGSSGENSDFGSTRNPWNKEYVPGGSSSGSAASVASGFTLVSTGTDTGGSIRNPANLCGVVGFKPTYGVVSRYGVIAMASSLDCMGVFARTTEDVEKMFSVTKGEDGHDATVKNVLWQKPSAKLKLGIPKEYFTAGLAKEVEDAVLKAAELYKKNGIELVEVSLPHTKYGISVYYIIQPAEVSSNLGRYDGIRYGGNREAFEDEAKRRIMLGSYVLSAGYYDEYYLKAMKVRTKIIEDFDKVFEKVDALISPVVPTPAFKLGEKTNDPIQMYLADILTVPANLAGIPGIALPYGFTKKGLPLGFQLLGPKFSEPTLFELGKIFEEITEYRPKLAF
ncbi:Asp-tRNA(Asn)/Glu-tRNA(Gln) amidotransferase subunit GatA [Candidatus Woesebacteria bacterium]|nr:Asp-tRNA(Asn)/Glu-tRNA(Gln) amidotransferase subunit GatA [Candidatus Woesebacteria bacterium]